MAGNLGHFVLLYALDVVVGQRPRVDPIPYWYCTIHYCRALLPHQAMRPQAPVAAQCRPVLVGIARRWIRLRVESHVAGVCGKDHAGLVTTPARRSARMSSRWHRSSRVSCL